MIKAFISHSSAQKDFAQELVNKIGRDYCKIDCFDFEPAYKSIDEIFRAIESCTIFVLLISREALASEWVQKEIYKAKDKLTTGQLEQFWPYIIDSSLSLEDVPSWMVKEECFNLKYFVSPEMLRKDIEQKIRRLIWRENPKIMARETAIIGRSTENEAFENKRYSNRGRNLRGLIISGRNGVGKDAFARQCLYKLGKPKEIEPYRISLDVKESIENFIIYLNLYCRLYSTLELEIILSSAPKDKAKVAVKLLNKLYDSQTVVFVEDNMACVLPNRDVSEWLIDIIEDPELNKQIGLFIKSCISPNSYVESDYPKLAHIQLLPLNKNDRKKLFYQYAEYFDLTDIADSDVNFFVDKLLQSPSLILNAVEACANKGVRAAKQDIDHLILLGTKKMKPLLDMFMNEELSKHILIILSTFEFVSFDFLDKVFEEQYQDVQKIISKMMVYGIVSTFGPSDSFVRLDHFISDYVKRNRIPLPSDLAEYVVFTSSIAPYGAAEELKKETTLPTPNTAYGISKLVAEKIHEKWQNGDTAHRQLTIVRPGVVFGKGENGNFTRLYWAIRGHKFAYPGRKDTIKACIYVKELVRFMLYRLEHHEHGVELYNCCFEPAYTIQHIVEAMKKVTGLTQFVPDIPNWVIMPMARAAMLLGSPMGICPARVKKLQISTNICGEKLKNCGYQFKWSFEEALVDWYEDNDRKYLK